jgi:hypothetical protein
MKNRPRGYTRAASSSDRKQHQAVTLLSDHGASCQANSSIAEQLGDGIHLAAIWRGPRDRSRAIQFALRQFNGHEFLDIRQYESSSGYMIPTSKGLTISIAQLGRFADATGKAYRRAVSLGLTRASS